MAGGQADDEDEQEGLGLPSQQQQPQKKRRRRTKAEMEVARAMEANNPNPAPQSTPGSKKRGRPSKSEMEARRAAITAQGGDPDQVLGKPAPPQRGRKRKNGAGGGATHTGAYLGSTVHGVFDGTYDAGYFVTVRVDNSDVIFRGVVFGDGVAVPVTRANDIAPGVKMLDRVRVNLPAYPPTHVQPAPGGASSMVPTG